MRITFLGTGGAFTDYRVNYHNNAVVWTSDGPVLIDCGTTACQSLRELALPAAGIRAVLFTHLHGDHASPEQLIWERYYLGPGTGPAYNPTQLVAPADLIRPLKRGLHPYLNEFTDPDGRVREGGVDVLVDAIEARSIEIGGVSFRWFRVGHVSGDGVDKPAYGIELDDGSTRVLWSGDTAFHPRWVIEAVEDPRVAMIFHECTFMPAYRGSVHTHYEELCTLPEHVRERVTLMHHTEVPDGLQLLGFAGAACRHQSFNL